MKRAFIVAALLAASSLALAAVSVTEGAGTHDLYKGSSKVKAFPDHASCAAAAASAAAGNAVGTYAYGCRNTTAILVKVSAPAKPQGVFQMLSCPSGSVSGAQWRQDADYVPAPAPAFWKLGPFKPDTPQVGACPPAPPPPAMHAGLQINEAAFAAMPVHAGVSDVRISTAVEFPPNTQDAPAFRTVCLPVQYSFNDHIVYPDMPGHAHGHINFGNTNGWKADAVMTDGNATCRGGTMNMSAEWVPALMWDWTTGEPAEARILIVYYKVGPWMTPEAVQLIPRDLLMIAGDPTASAPVRFGPVAWSCNGNAKAFDSDEPWTGGPHKIPQCAVGEELWSSVAFPPCWDGVHLDSADHKSHVSYPESPWTATTLPNGCPAAFPIEIPQVTFQVVYPVKKPYDAGKAAVTSDAYKKLDPTIPGGLSMHGDYHARWLEEFQRVWRQKCLIEKKDCGAHMLGDGRTMDSFDGN